MDIPQDKLQEVLDMHFIQSFKTRCEQVNETAHKKGWYDIDQEIKGMELPPRIEGYINKLQRATRIALMHSELSEGLEGDRKNLRDDKIPEFTMMEAELADTIIRIMDFAHEHQLRVAQAIVAKASFNKGREYLHGGKAF